MKPNKDHRITFRMADDDYERLVKRCQDIEMSKSEYLRYLVSIPMVADAEDAEASDKFIVLDRWALRRMSRELTKWGYHYNQAVHATNSINYYFVHGKATTPLLEQKAETIEIELAAVNENAQRIVYELASMQASTFIEER